MPPSTLYGFVRDVPMIVPPRGRIPEISRGPSGWKSCSTMPAPALTHADHLVPARPGPARDGADDRVQSGAVAAARQHSDLH